MTQLYSRRVRFLLAWSARLVIFAYVLQLIAFDHWRADPAHIVGIEGSSRHIAHCHGDSTACADSSSLATALIEASLTPAAPTAVIFDHDPARLTPSDTFLPILTTPPRSA